MHLYFEEGGVIEDIGRLKYLFEPRRWMCPESCRKASWRKAPADWLTTLPRYAA